MGSHVYTHRDQKTFTITSLTQTCFNPAQTSTPRGAFSPCCCKQRNRLLNHISISSCQILSLWLSEPIPKWQHCSGLEHATFWLRVRHATTAPPKLDKNVSNFIGIGLCPSVYPNISWTLRGWNLSTSCAVIAWNSSGDTTVIKRLYI